MVGVRKKNLDNVLNLMLYSVQWNYVMMESERVTDITGECGYLSHIGHLCNSHILYLGLNIHKAINCGLGVFVGYCFSSKESQILSSTQGPCIHTWGCSFPQGLNFRWVQQSRRLVERYSEPPPLTLHLFFLLCSI